MWVEFNNNPVARNVGDCSVRAVSKALDIDWENAYALISANGFAMGDMPSSDAVWGSVLRQHGFTKHIIPNSCPDCYTVKDFAKDNNDGIYVVGTGGHVVTIVDGNYYDSWDSGNEICIYFWSYEPTGWSFQGEEKAETNNAPALTPPPTPATANNATPKP